MVAYVAAALLALLSVAGFSHAIMTPREQALWAPVAPSTGTRGMGT